VKLVSGRLGPGYAIAIIQHNPTMGVDGCEGPVHLLEQFTSVDPPSYLTLQLGGEGHVSRVRTRYWFKDLPICAIFSLLQGPSLSLIGSTMPPICEVAA
jgi:hypothetical protein